MSEKFKIDEKGIWYCENEEGHCFDDRLSIEISKLVLENSLTSVVDFGCGPGKYVKFLLSQGIDCIGYDGNPNTPNYTDGVCGVLDLSEVFTLKNNFDCVISLEVGEHIPKEYEQIYIDNITKHSNNLLLCSWAIPGQGGDGHINCQSNEYIINEIEKRGFVFDSSLASRLRKNSSLSWFKNTLFVFRKVK